MRAKLHTWDSEVKAGCEFKAERISLLVPRVRYGIEPLASISIFIMVIDEACPTQPEALLNRKHELLLFSPSKLQVRAHPNDSTLCLFRAKWKRHPISDAFTASLYRHIALHPLSLSYMVSSNHNPTIKLCRSARPSRRHCQ